MEAEDNRVKMIGEREGGEGEGERERERERITKSCKTSLMMLQKQKRKDLLRYTKDLGLLH